MVIAPPNVITPLVKNPAKKEDSFKPPQGREVLIVDTNAQVSRLPLSPTFIGSILARFVKWFARYGFILHEYRVRVDQLGRLIEACVSVPISGALVCR